MADSDQKEDQSRKRRRTRSRTKSSQTDEADELQQECCDSCHSVANTLAEINNKLDVALEKIKEIEELKERISKLEKENESLKESTNYNCNQFVDLKCEVQANFPATAKRMSKLEEGVKFLCKKLSEEQERSIKLESHSRRNNLNFFKIEEQQNETIEKTENILRNFIIKELKVDEEEMQNISIERDHRIGKPSTTPRPIIAKFSFFKDKEYIRSKARNLKGTKYSLAEDFPKEIVERRKELLPNLREAKASGQKATVKYDKLIIEGKVIAGSESYRSNKWMNEIFEMF